MFSSKNNPEEFPTGFARLLGTISTITSLLFICLGGLTVLASLFASGAPGGLGLFGATIVVFALLTVAFSLYSLSNLWTQFRAKNYKKLKYFISVPYLFALPLIVLILINFLG